MIPIGLEWPPGPRSVCRLWGHALWASIQAHPEVMRAYEAEKRRAWGLHSGDSYAYGDEKAAWIERTEAVALEWYAGQK